MSLSVTLGGEVCSGKKESSAAVLCWSRRENGLPVNPEHAPVVSHEPLPSPHTVACGLYFSSLHSMR